MTPPIVTSLVLVVALLVVALLVVVVVVARRNRSTSADLTAELRAIALDLIRLPGRLRRLAADPRTPRRARWALIALAIYVASPIDLIPDILPVIGHLDELLIVPLVLRHVRRSIPPEAWAAHFPPRPTHRES